MQRGIQRPFLDRQHLIGFAFDRGGDRRRHPR
jgi:hypothetical protein